VPELPEVETVVRELRPRLLGRGIRNIFASTQRLRGKWSPAWKTALVGRRILEVWRRGKWIIVDLNGAGHRVFHLGMTGRLTIFRALTPIEVHTHLRFLLDRGQEELRFRDVRRFGSATYFKNRASLDLFFQDKSLGPEPFTLESKYWHKKLLSTNRCLKAILLDQTVVAGVGNIYADESLFRAQLNPARIGRETTLRESERLRRAIIAVLHEAITKRGSSIRDFVGGTGREGEYQREFRVYGQTGEPCPRCRSPIVCIRLAGRSTHFCRQCQPERAVKNGARAGARGGSGHRGRQK
jgi:formamidopyrimidine-DNA glycosylase